MQGVAIKLNSEAINLNASLLSDKNVHYDAIRVHGPLDAPAVEVGTVLAGVYSRVSDGLVNLGKGSLLAGVDIAKGGLNVTKQLGSGALKLGKNLEEGVLELGTGLVTLDRRRIKKGIEGTTRDSLGITLDSVQGSGTAVGGGLKRSVSDLKGEAGVKAWNAAIATRHQAAMQLARKALSHMPYPPDTD